MASAANVTASSIRTRHDWRAEEISALYRLPFSNLLFEAQQLHRASFDPASIEIATLLSIKTGGCPEDCGYCSQSASLPTGVKASKLMDLEAVIEAAAKAKEAGATRFCLGAAWRSPKERDLDRVIPMIQGIRRLGMEACVTLGMLDQAQAKRLADAGLDYYNHNVDTSPRYYPRVATTRSMDDRLQTLENVRASGLKVCCGGVVGLGETVDDRLEMLRLLANLPKHPESVPLNLWNYIEGAPLADRAERPDGIAFARLVAVARIMMPTSVIRIAAGRQYMSDELHALCFAAGVNSIFNGEVLLTTPNPEGRSDQALLERLGFHQATTPHIVDRRREALC